MLHHPHILYVAPAAWKIKPLAGVSHQIYLLVWNVGVGCKKPWEVSDFLLTAIVFKNCEQMALLYGMAMCSYQRKKMQNWKISVVQP